MTLPLPLDCCCLSQAQQLLVPQYSLTTCIHPIRHVALKPSPVFDLAPYAPYSTSNYTFHCETSPSLYKCPSKHTQATLDSRGVTVVALTSLDSTTILIQVPS